MNGFQRISVFPPAVHPTPPFGAGAFSFYPAERDVFRPRERDPLTCLPLTVSTWAARYRIVTEGGRRGPWSNEFTPSAVAPMDAWSAPYIRKIFLAFSPQSSKSQIALNCLAYTIDQDPGPCMYVAPTEAKAKEIGRGKIEALITKTPRLTRYISPSTADNTTLYYRFAHGMELKIVWAGSPTALSEASVEQMIFDEIDKYDEFASRKEADPLSLGEQRTNAYPFTRKLLYLSTPSAEPSAIFGLLVYEADIVYALEACCPVCGYYQRMTDDNIVWPKEYTDPRTVLRRRLARYACPACSMLWSDAVRDAAVRSGRWVPGRMTLDYEWEPLVDPPPRPEAVGYWRPSWYSPFISLSRVAADKLRAAENPSRRIAYVTQHQVKPYREIVRSTTQSEILRARAADLPPQTVPAAALALTCFIDVQKYSCWFAVRAFARDYTSWLIHWGQLGSLDDAEELILNRRYQLADSFETMGIWRAGIDTGGSDTEQYGVSMTEATYWWLVRNIPRARAKGIALFGTKGSSRTIPGTFKLGEELLKTPSGKKLPTWLRLTLIDTDVMKSLYHDHIDNAIRGEGRGAFLHAGSDSDFRVYLRQILAEEKRRDRRGHVEWVKKGRDNHLFDCEVGCLSLAHYQWPGGGVNMLRSPVMLDSGAARPQTRIRRTLSSGVEA